MHTPRAARGAAMVLVLLRGAALLGVQLNVGRALLLDLRLFEQAQARAGGRTGRARMRSRVQ